MQYAQKRNYLDVWKKKDMTCIFSYKRTNFTICKTIQTPWVYIV